MWFVRSFYVCSVCRINAVTDEKKVSEKRSFVSLLCAFGYYNKFTMQKYTDGVFLIFQERWHSVLMRIT